MIQRERWTGQISESHKQHAGISVRTEMYRQWECLLSSLPLISLPRELLTARCPLLCVLVSFFKIPTEVYQPPGISIRFAQAPLRTLERPRPPQKFCKFGGRKGNLSQEMRMTFSWSPLSQAMASLELVYSVKALPTWPSFMLCTGQLT